jgi:hypothetical protein
VTTVVKCSIMIMGLYILSIILYGAANKLDIKQRTKYGNVSTTTDDSPTAISFLQYQATIGMFGPKRWYHHRPRTETNRRSDNASSTHESSTTGSSTTNTTITNDALQQQEPIQSTEALLDSTLAATEEETFR